MLDNHDSSLMKEFPQDPLNRSLEVYKAKFANYNPKSQDNLDKESHGQKSGSVLHQKQLLSDYKENPKNKVDIERTDQVFIKSRLNASNEPKNHGTEEQESVRRSNVRGLEVMISEKSHEIEPQEKSLSIKEELQDENKTLKYDGTEERSQRTNSNQSKKSQKEAIYGQLEKIMGNCFSNEAKETVIDAQEYKTLKYADTDENNEGSDNEILSPMTSNISSPATAKRVENTQKEEIFEEKNDNLEVQKSEKAENNEIITPRDFKNSFSYQTPNVRNNTKDNLDLYAQKEVSKAILQASYESGRREDAFNLQFYSNSSNSRQKTNKEILEEADKNDDNIRIYVDQWDGDNSQIVKRINLKKTPSLILIMQMKV